MPNGRNSRWFRFTLPVLTASEAAELMSLIDELQSLLWDEYGRDLAHLSPDADHEAEEPRGRELDDDIPF